MSRVSRSIRVLHVDDDPEFADLAATLLEREQDRFEVETATGAGEGLERLAGDRFDCVVSDYDMPGRDGIEFLRAVREDHPDLPFVLFTGKGSEEIASVAISAGVTDYIQKESGTDQYALLANRIRNAVERARAERQRRRQLNAIETAREGISILDEDGHYIYVNEAFADLHGYDPEEMVGEHWELAYPEGDVAEVREEILPEVERTGYWHGETTSRRSDGTEVTVDHTLATTDRGELVCTVRDVSGRKEREERLRRSTARLEALFENSPDMINVHDLEGNIVDPNPRLCEETGYDAETLTDMKVWELDRSIDPDEAHALWEGMAVGDRARLEGEYRRRDGSAFPVEVHIRRLRLEGEDRFMAISRDVTDRKEREHELERYERILETTDDIAFVVDEDRTVTYVNGTVSEYVDVPREALVGEDVMSLADEYVSEPDDRERFAAVIDRTLDADGGGDRPERLELPLDLPGGEVTFEYQFSPLIEDRTTTGVVVTMRDVTDRLRRERALRAERDRLNEFASVVSHDLRNPLQLADGRLELAREECDSEHLAPIADALDRMDRIIGDLLVLAREGEGIGPTEPVAVREVVESAWALVSDAAEGADLRYREEGPPLPEVEADRDRLHRLLENLLRNAIDHGGGDVTVTVGGLDDGFYVEDDGPGIPADERDAVFDAGYSTAEDGTGFGLNIVSRIADAHGWTVRAVEGADGGARFEVTGIGPR
ncbi:MAG: PAS domain S-box protein [Haloferacaceae archaeon]